MIWNILHHASDLCKGKSTNGRHINNLAILGGGDGRLFLASGYCVSCVGMLKELLRFRAFVAVFPQCRWSFLQIRPTLCLSGQYRFCSLDCFCTTSSRQSSSGWLIGKTKTRHCNAVSTSTARPCPTRCKRFGRRLVSSGTSSGARRLRARSRPGKQCGLQRLMPRHGGQRVAVASAALHLPTSNGGEYRPRVANERELRPRDTNH